MNRFLAALAACLILPSIALAQPAVVPHADNGNIKVPLKVDADGNLKITDETPYQLQNDLFIGASDTLGVAVTTGLKQIGLGWSVSPFGDRVIRIKRKFAGTSLDPCYLFIYGSDDNVTYYPVIGSGAWVASGQAGADTTKVKPYRLILPAVGSGTAGTLFYKLTLPSDVYPGRYLAIFANRDSVTGSTSQTLSISYEGRWK